MDDTNALWVISRVIEVIDESTTQVLLDIGNTGPSWNSIRRVAGGKGMCVGIKIFEAKQDAENIAKKLRTRVNGQRNVSVITLAELVKMIMEKQNCLTGK